MTPALISALLLAVAAIALGAWGILGASIAIVDATHAFEVDRPMIRRALTVLWLATVLFGCGSSFLARTLM